MSQIGLDESGIHERKNLTMYVNIFSASQRDDVMDLCLKKMKIHGKDVYENEVVGVKLMFFFKLR